MGVLMDSSLCMEKTYGRIDAFSTRVIRAKPLIWIITIISCRFLHKELTNISFNVIGIYEIQIVILIASFFVTLTGFYYILFASLFFHNIDVHSHWVAKLVGLLWSVAYTYRFYNINITCARVSSEVRLKKYF